MRLEHVAVLEAVADSTEAHEGILFFGETEIRDLLVAADVQCADDNGLALHDQRRLLVRLKLLVLGGELISVHKQELGAEQSHTLAVGVHRLGGVLGRADVAEQLVLVAVGVRCHLAAQGLQLAFLAQIGGALGGEFLDLLGIGRDKHVALEAVNDDDLLT